MKDKSGVLPVRLVLHKHDERHIRKFHIEISPSSGLREKKSTSVLTKPSFKSCVYLLTKQHQKIKPPLNKINEYFYFL
jgi:hypothetical protein